jgi:tetratricopeptide (TPR) repeat protein
MATNKTLLQQAQELNEKKEHQAVIDLLSDTVLQAENSADLYGEKAQAYWRLDMRQLCGEMADKALALDARNAKAYNYKGNTYWGLKEYDEAIQWYGKAIEANPKYDAPYNGLGNAYYDKREYDDAIKWYLKAIELDPRDEYAYVKIGKVYHDKKEYDSAIGWYQKAIELDPRDEYAYVKIGKVYHDKKEYDSAIGWYQKAIELDPRDEYAYAKLGDVYYDKKEYYAAIQWYQKSIEVNPEYEYAYTSLGDVYHDKKEYEAAIGWYQKSIEVNPEYKYAYTSLGDLYQDRKEYDAAILWYQKAIEVNPEYEYAYTRLGDVYHVKKEYEAAIGWYQKAIEVNPGYEYAYTSLGSTYKNKGEYKEAIEWYQKAIEANPKLDSAYYDRALVYEAMGENEKAITDYNLYINLTSDKEDYFTKRAQERVAELKKAINNVQYSGIADLVDKIKRLLLFEDGCITHYTGLSTAKALVLGTKSGQDLDLKPSPFRLSEGAFLNDTSEGRELFAYLHFQAKARKSHDMEALSFATKPFIGSFVAETKHDDLTLWRMYGKEEKEEAKGCAITLHQRLLIEAIYSKLNPKEQAASNTQTSNKPQTGNDFSFYRVAYKSYDGQFVLPGASNEKAQQLNDYMLELAAKVKGADDNPQTADQVRQDIVNRLNDIAYLFKTIEYQHEQEIRLVLDGVGFEKQLNINATPPRVYIELVNIRPLIQKITIGPKVERGDEWAAAFYYSLDKDNLRPEICISHLPYK